MIRDLLDYIAEPHGTESHLQDGMREIEGLYLKIKNMDYNKEFNITPQQVKKEVNQIKREKKLEKLSTHTTSKKR